jgi:hypothetical protein
VREDRSTAGQSWTRRDVKRWAEGAPYSVAKRVVEVRDGKRGSTARQPPLPLELSSLAGRPPPLGFQPPRAAGQRHPAKERKSARLCASTRVWAAVLQAMGEGRSQRAGGGGATGFVKGRSRACRWGVPTPPRPVGRRTCLTVAASREQERRKTHSSTAEEAVKDGSGDED